MTAEFEGQVPHQPEDIGNGSDSTSDAIDRLFDQFDPEKQKQESRSDQGQRRPDNEPEINEGQFRRADDQPKEQAAPAQDNGGPQRGEYDHTAFQGGNRRSADHSNQRVQPGTGTSQRSKDRLKSRREFLGILGSTAAIGLVIGMCGKPEAGKKLFKKTFQGAGIGIEDLANQGYEEAGDIDAWLANEINAGRPGSVEEFLTHIVRTKDDAFEQKNKDDIADIEKWNNNMKDAAKAIDELRKQIGIETFEISDWAHEQLEHSRQSSDWLQRLIRLYKKEEGYETLDSEELANFKAYYMQVNTAGDTWN